MNAGASSWIEPATCPGGAAPPAVLSVGEFFDLLFLHCWARSLHHDFVSGRGSGLRRLVVFSRLTLVHGDGLGLLHDQLVAFQARSASWSTSIIGIPAGRAASCSGSASRASNSRPLDWSVVLVTESPLGSGPGVQLGGTGRSHEMALLGYMSCGEPGLRRVLVSLAYVPSRAVTRADEPGCLWLEGSAMPGPLWVVFLLCYLSVGAAHRADMTARCWVCGTGPHLLLQCWCRSGALHAKNVHKSPDKGGQKNLLRAASEHDLQQQTFGGVDPVPVRCGVDPVPVRCGVEFAEQDQFHRQVQTGHIGEKPVPESRNLQSGKHLGELCRRRLLPVLKETGPEAAGCGRPFGRTLCQGGFEVSVDVGGEVRRDGSVGGRGPGSP